MLFDLSHSLDSRTPPFLGDPKLRLTQIATLEKDGFSNYLLECGMHIGTHIDGLSHITTSGELISESPLARFCGDVVFLNFKKSTVIDYSSDLDGFDLAGKMVLIYTGWDVEWGSAEYFTKHPILTEPMAQWLIGGGAKLVGIDFPSPDVAPFKVHKLLLENKIHILENLTGLEQLIGKKSVLLMAFPLKLNADSSPVRAVAWCVSGVE